MDMKCRSVLIKKCGELVEKRKQLETTIPITQWAANDEWKALCAQISLLLDMAADKWTNELKERLQNIQPC